MEITKDLIVAVRALAGSDSKAAPLVGVSQTTFSQWRAGTDFPSDDNALKIAELLKLDPAYVLAVVNGDRAKSKQTRATWQRMAEKFRDAAVVAAMAFGAASFGVPAPAEANFTFPRLPSGSAPNSAANASGIHIVRRRRARAAGSGIAQLVQQLLRL